MRKSYLVILSVVFMLNCAACSSPESNTNKALKDGTDADQGQNEERKSKNGSSNKINNIHDKDKSDNAEGNLNKGSKPLTISVRTKSRFIELAAKKFQGLNPDVPIKINEYTARGQKGDNSIINREEEDEKYINSISTELMSGKGADIIFVQGLPYIKYAARGFFEDIGEYMEADSEFTAGNYFSNLFDAMRYKGSLYVLPADYSFEMLVGETDLFSTDVSGQEYSDAAWTWDDFFNLSLNHLKNRAGNPPAGKYMLFSSSERLFELMLRTNLSRFVNEDSQMADFSSPQFAQMLNFCKSLSDKNWIDHEDIDRCLFVPLGIYSFQFIASGVKSTKGQVYFYRLPRDDGKQGMAFHGGNLLSVSSSSKRKDDAWRFIKFLLSEEMQSSPEISGFPVNRDALRQKASREMENLSGTGESITSLMEKYIHLIEDITAGINFSSRLNPEIRKIVMNEAKSFFSGQKTAREVGNIIQNKVGTYLDEQY